MCVFLVIVNAVGDAGTRTMVSETVSSIPGIDEAMSFAELMKYDSLSAGKADAR